jgi:hypothetical protein
MANNDGKMSREEAGRLGGKILYLTWGPLKLKTQRSRSCLISIANIQDLLSLVK